MPVSKRAIAAAPSSNAKVPEAEPDFKPGLTLEEVSRQIEKRRQNLESAKTIQDELIDSALMQSQLLKICLLCLSIGTLVGALFSTPIRITNSNMHQSL